MINVVIAVGISKQKRTFGICAWNRFKLLNFLVAFGACALFAVQAQSLLARHNEQVFFRSVAISNPEFLQWPQLLLQMDITRNPSSAKAAYTPEVTNMQWPALIPKWAVIYYLRKNQQYYVTLNAVTNGSLAKFNMSLDDARSQYPLETHFQDNQLHAWLLFSSENFTIYDDGDGNYDQIGVDISSFESDTSTSSAIEIPGFNLLPCEELNLYIALQHYALKSRENSPCRDEYPESLKKMFPQRMPESLFFNPINAPHLPYDQKTCVRLCDANYWMPRCGCYSDPESWRYAGMPENVTVCPSDSNNCNHDGSIHAPPTEISKCECYQKCIGYKFHLIAAEKIKYSLGNSSIFVNV